MNDKRIDSIQVFQVTGPRTRVDIDLPARQSCRLKIYSAEPRVETRCRQATLEVGPTFMGPAGGFRHPRCERPAGFSCNLGTGPRRSIVKGYCIADAIVLQLRSACVRCRRMFLWAEL
jgi:hypothetical protein